MTEPVMVGDLVMMQVQAVIDERTTAICLHAAGQIQPVGPGVYETLAAEAAAAVERSTDEVVAKFRPGMSDDELEDLLAHLPPDVRAMAIKQIRDREAFLAMVPESTHQSIIDLIEHELRETLDGHLVADVGAVVEEVAETATNAAEVLARAQYRRSRLDDHSALLVYEGQGYMPVNETLRYGRGPRTIVVDGVTHRTIDVVNDMTRLIAESGRIDEPITLWRGVRNVPDELQVGRTFTEKAFTSTSVNQKSAMQFTAGSEPTLLEIRVPEGHRVRPMNASDYDYDREVPVFSAPGIQSGEGEVLLQRGARYNVVGERQDTIDGNRVRVLEMEVEGYDVYRDGGT